MPKLCKWYERDSETEHLDPIYCQFIFFLQLYQNCNKYVEWDFPLIFWAPLTGCERGRADVEFAQTLWWGTSWVLSQIRLSRIINCILVLLEGGCIYPLGGGLLINRSLCLIYILDALFSLAKQTCGKLNILNFGWMA